MTYRLKIIIKNSKPPIWRQVLIPGGITFSQLAIILNEIYGLEHSDFFQFEFYQRKIQLEEEKEGKVFQPNFYYDLQEASNTFVDDYFNTESWCSYFVNGMAFRVEIAERLEAELPLTIIKAKGEVQNTTTNCEALTELLNQRIQMVIKNDIAFEKMEKILEENPVRIYRTLKPRSVEGNIRKSGNSIIKEMSEGLVEAMARRKDEIKKIEEAYLNEEGDSAKKEIGKKVLELCRPDLEKFQEEILKNYGVQNVEQSSQERYLLRDSLMGYTKKELMDIAKNMHIRGYGSLTLAALAEKVSNELLSKNTMKKNFGLCNDEEIKAFLNVANQKEEFFPENEMWKNLNRLIQLNYIDAFDDDSVEVPTDVKEAYQKINTEEFHNVRKKRVWLLDCLRMMDMLYVVAPIDILVQMYQKRKGFRLSKNEIMEIYYDIPEEERIMFFHQNKLISEDFYERGRYKTVEEEQEDKSFYIPNPDEVICYVRNLYPKDDKNYQELVHFFERKVGMKFREAEILVISIYRRISSNQGIQSVFGEINRWGIVFKSQLQVEQLMSILQKINNSTRMFIHRGHTPNEISKMGVSGNLLEKVIPIKSISEKSVKEKVYPNDPCPCGSGKKYKKCCGRKS